MDIIPDPTEDRELRALYAGNPIIDRAERALRAFHVSDAEDAAVMLPMWAHVGELTERERRAVVARFVDVEPAEAPDPYRVDAEGFEHPSWCDLGQCTAPSTLRQRGVDEANVPVYMRDVHLSTPWVIDAGRVSDVTYTVQAWRGVDQPVTDEVEAVDLVAESDMQNLRIGLSVAVDQLAPLARAFAGARDTARPGGER